MTHNQIQYMANIETQRHNVATETETHRSNRANEKETKRHNKVTEKETKRHNIAYEAETNRHNLATEDLASKEYLERARHNRVSEAQNAQSILNSYEIGLSQAAAAHRQAVAAQANAAANQQNADTRVVEAQIAKENASLRAIEAEIANANAETNRINAVTNQYKVEHDALMNEQKVEQGWHNVASGYLDEAGDVLRSIFGGSRK